jgi:hypothetical protein
VDRRRTLGWAVGAAAIGEVISAFVIEFPIAAIVFAVLFALAWLWLRRGGIAPVIALAVLFAIELAGLPFYERKDAYDWVVQVAFLLIGVVGLVGAVAVIRGERGSRAATA